MAKEQLLYNEPAILDFLIAISGPLLDYYQESKDDLSLQMGFILEKSPAYVDCIEKGICASKEEKHIYLIVQDFWYGLVELFHKRCACEEKKEQHSEAHTRQEAANRITRFAERIIHFFNMHESQDFVFESDVSEDFLDWYIETIRALSNNRASLEEILSQLKDRASFVTNPLVYAKIELFMRYFYLATRSFNLAT